MKVYFMRHGETDWNVSKILQERTDILLNETGREQARQVKSFIDDLRIDICYSSPLRRASETAEIILDDRGIPIIKDSRLLEREYESLRGMTWAEAAERGFDIESTELQTIENGETPENVFSRISSLFDELKEKREFENILVISHWEVSKFIRYYFGDLPEEGVSTHKLENCIITEYDL